MPAGSYKDIGKAANDLFDGDEYGLNRVIEISANEDKVSLTATTTLENNGDTITEVEYQQGNFNVTLDTDSSQSISYKNYKVAGISATAKVEREASKASSDKFTATFKKKADNYNAQLKVAADASGNIKTDTQLTFSKDAFNFGVKIPFNVQKGFDANKIGVGFQYAADKNTFALTSPNPLAQQFSFSFLRAFNCDTTGFASGAAQVNYSPDAEESLNFNVGGTFQVDKKSSFQGFVNCSTAANCPMNFRGKYSYALTPRLDAQAAFKTSLLSPLANISTGFKLQFQ